MRVRPSNSAVAFVAPMASASFARCESLNSLDVDCGDWLDRMLLSASRVMSPRTAVPALIDRRRSWLAFGPSGPAMAPCGVAS